jgi:CheY-like chemotaxis protein/signal transduction histidine kinase
MKISKQIMAYIGGSAAIITLAAFIALSYGLNSVLAELETKKHFRTPTATFNEIVEKKIRSAIIVSGVITLAGFLVFCGILIYFSIRISSPLQAAVEFSQKLARGDFSPKLPRKYSRDEIGELNKALNFMRDRMQNYISKLEKSHLREKTARQEAEKANHLKSDFLANMSLELRNPLNAIMGFSSLMMKETDEGLSPYEVMKKAEAIYKSAERLNNQISSLLQLSKLDSENIDLNIEDFETAEFIREVGNFNKLNSEEKSIAIESHFSSDTPEKLRTDKDVLFHIISAIISCMIKNLSYESKISFGCKSSGNNVIFWIKDTPEGHVSSPIASVYNKFLQTQAEPFPTIAGKLLLNLTIAKANTALLNGDLTAYTLENDCSYFEIIFNKGNILPDSRSRTSATHTATNLQVGELIETLKAKKEPPLKRKLQDASSERKTILLAEDNEANRMLVELVFRDSEYDLECVPDGLVCLEALSRKKFDILLLDLQMPNLDGYGVIDNVRKDDKFNDMPIVVLTAYLEQGDKQSLIMAGANECILKPINIEKLTEVVEDLINKN